METTARDRLIYPIIDRNYLFVISPRKDGAVVWSVFRVSIANDESNKAPNSKNRLDSFLNLYSNNPAGIVSSEFPVELLSLGTFSGSIYEGEESILDQVIDNADYLRTKTFLILDGLKIAGGSKENLKVDDLIISYREIEDENGNITFQEMGRDRVKKVGNNNIDLIANPKAKGERTQLYADGGRVSRRGYIAKTKEEVAAGISTGVNFANSVYPYVKLDYRLGSLTNETNLRNTFVIVETEFLTDLTIEDFDVEVVTIVNMGLQKTFNLGRKFNVSVFGLGSVYSEVRSVFGGDETKELDINQVKAGVSFAIKFKSLQIIPHVTYVLEGIIDSEFSVIDNFYGSSVIVGGGLRWNF